MSLWFVAFQGSTPIGGPIVGAIMALAGARAGLGAGGLACLCAAGLGVAAQRRLRRPPEFRDPAVADAATAVAITQTAQLG